MVDGAFAKEAGGAGGCSLKQDVLSCAWQTGSGQFGTGASEGDDHARPERGGHMHRAAVVGENQVAQFQRGAEFAQIGLPGQVNSGWLGLMSGLG